MNTPKTWLESEICELIAQEAKEYKHDCVLRGLAFSYIEEARNIYALLDRHGLIQDTP